MKQRRFFILLLILLCCYLGGYCWFRATHIEVEARNGKPYVIFLANTIPLYYLFRPLMYADGALTGMGFHLGPHRETQ